MNVSIIGTGNMAKGIGQRVISGGHKLTLHAHDSAKGQALASDLTAAVPAAHVNVVEIGGALDDVVVLAVPYGAVAEIAEAYHGFSGKTVIDITNPIDFSTFQLVTEPGESGAQTLAKLMPKAHVVKGFNTIFAGTLASGVVGGQPLDVFLAGDDATAKQAVSELVNSSGMRAVDAGPLAHARHLEGLALIHISVQEQLGTSWVSSVKILG